MLKAEKQRIRETEKQERRKTQRSRPAGKSGEAKKQGKSRKTEKQRSLEPAKTNHQENSPPYWTPLKVVMESGGSKTLPSWRSHLIEIPHEMHMMFLMFLWFPIKSANNPTSESHRPSSLGNGTWMCIQLAKLVMTRFYHLRCRGCTPIIRYPHKKSAWRLAYNLYIFSPV